jgi:chemotaxis protein methyltransferase CheR
MTQATADGSAAVREVVESARATGPAFDHDDLRFFAEAMRRRAGIILPDTKAALVFRRLAPRVRQLGLASFAAYRERLWNPDDAEWDHVVGQLTTNHSHFFREVHHFKLLSRHLSGLIQPGRCRLRIWSAACAAGQEPYSMAILITHLLAGRRDVDARVLATDVDRAILAAAERARYTPEDLGRLPRFARPFIRREADGTSTVAQGPRSLVRFKFHNLVGDDWPMRGPFDAIFCRNVLIYLSRADQARVVDRLARLLKVGGILCLGHSEVARGTAPIRRIEAPSSYVRV